MRLDTQPSVLSSGSFTAIGCLNTVTVGEPEALPMALTVVQREIAAIDRACSRFREDSELSRVNAAGGGTFALTPLLEEAMAAALRAADTTAGAVDPTVGSCLRELGYDVTFRDLPEDGPALRIRVRERLDWRSLQLDRLEHTLSVPPGVELDLGASGKAWAADRAAAAAALAIDAPVLVCSGGDVAVAGAPDQGWPVRVALAADGAGAAQDVVLFEGGLATSGPQARRWRRGGVELHHIVDPATGLPADTPWAMVTVAAASCLDANAAATAALIYGRRAPDWLEEHRLPARLVATGGEVRTVGGWPC